MNTITATLQNTPLHTKVSHEFAAQCLTSVGDVVYHKELGPLFCDEITIGIDGCIEKIVFVGTSDKKKKFG